MNKFKLECSLALLDPNTKESLKDLGIRPTSFVLESDSEEELHKKLTSNFIAILAKHNSYNKDGVTFESEFNRLKEKFLN